MMVQLASASVGLALLLSTPRYAKELQGQSLNFRGIRPGQHHSHFHHRRLNNGFGFWPLYALPASDEADQTYEAAAPVEPSPPARVPSCHHTQETVTVPTGKGGTQQVTIYRC